MRMSVSGRSSSCSVTQEEEVVKRMHKTPKAPTKSSQIVQRKSERKRSLFPTASPSKSDDLGLMSPLSPSSCSSSQSIESPHFSPNGKFSTPPRTPNNDAVPTRMSPRVLLKKIEIKSSLFPDLKICTPKTRKSPRTPKTLMAKLLTPQSESGSEYNKKCLTSPLRKIRKRSLFEENVVAETDSSPSICSMSQEIDESLNSTSDIPTKLGIKPLSCESFYGCEPKVNKARTRLFIDTIESRSALKPLSRSLSKESLTSNRSFVVGGSRKRTGSNPTNRSKRSKSSGRKKGLQPGVWHNIKKPKQLKKIQAAEKPIISPKSRLAKMLKSPAKKEIKVKEKSLFQEYPKKRVSHLKKRSRQDSEDDFILDSFPNSLIKRKKLPTFQSHPSTYNVTTTNPENFTPDPNKKFMKYGQTRKATFTLNENVKLQIADGVMRIQTPKKRRKLYSGKKDIVEDFNDCDEGDMDIQNSIQGILNILEDDQEHSKLKINEEMISKCSDNLTTNLLQNQKLTPTKTSSGPQRSPLKPVTNLPTLIINDFESDEENLEIKKAFPSVEKNRGETTLETTGNMVSYISNILVNDGQNIISPAKYQFDENQSENLPPNQNKLYSLFYKQNWNKAEPANENNFTKSNENKKRILVPDDQYLLDAGQESIGIVTCKKCGVMYQAGDFADEATHNRFHNRLPELKFAGWLNERVVGKYPDGRVIMIVNADPKAWWQKVAKIVEIVDQELGFPEATIKSLFYKTVYLYISEKSKQIAGCLIAEECNVAYKMFPPLEGVEVDSCSKDPSPCKVGISRIWTALSHRRKGVATRMIECLQRTYLFGDMVRMDEIAFSVPSPAGKLLAQKVTGRLDFLVYGFP